MNKKAASAGSVAGPAAGPESESRRDFLSILAVASGAVGAGSVAWPLIDSMNPSADVLALASIEVSLAGVEVGQSVTVKWRGKPVFIRRRTEDEIREAEAVSLTDLVDPEVDSVRVKKPEWLVMVGVCTHLGCVPLGQKSSEPKGDFDGWFCPCHGSHYDSSGRIRKGPAPKNLEIPLYSFLNDSTVRIG